MIIHTVSESAALSTFPQSISLPSLNYSGLSCHIVYIEGQLHEYIELKEKVFHFGKHVSLPRLLLKHLALACDFKFWNWIFCVATITGCFSDYQTGRMDDLMIAEQSGHWLTGLISAVDSDIDNCTQADGSNFRY